MWNRNAAVSGLLVAAVVFAGACSDVPPTEPVAVGDQGSLFGRMAQRSSGGTEFGIDAAFVRIAQQHPGFGGMFYGEDGALNIYSTGVAALSTDALSAPLGALGVDLAAQPVNVLEAQYDFIQLNAMHRSVSKVLSLKGVVFTDADEARNRVTVGVEDAAAAASVEQALGMLGVPREAVIIETTEPIELNQTLRDAVRPVAGGLQIWRFIPPSSASICTLGFNVSSLNGAVRGFVTNSHCTEQRGVVTGTLWAQKQLVLPFEPIAIERHDLPFFQDGPCPEGRNCRYSDAAGAEYLPDVPHAFGEIYRTVDLGSLEIDPATPRWQIVAELPFPMVGQVLHKTGRTSGWTMGAVTATCVTSNVAGEGFVTMLCQDRVATTSAGGDSGAPYFLRVGETNNVALIGIHWGSGGGTTVMSAMRNIRCENQGPAPWITYPGQTPPAPVACPGR